MGSWNETCGLSGLPIPRGTPALLVVLGPGSTRDQGEDGRAGFCYPAGLWVPLCLPFPGTYDDDTGTISLDKAPFHWPFTQEVLREYRLSWQKRDAVMRPLPLEYNQTFLQAIERGWTSAMGPLGAISVGQVLIRKDIWDYLLSIEMRVFWGTSSRKTSHKAARQYLRTLLQQMRSSSFDNFQFELHLRNSTKSIPFVNALFSPYEVGFSFAFYRNALTRSLVEYIAREERERSLKDILRMLYEIADIAHVNQMMMVLRRAWQPQPGKGSQDLEWSLHEGFAQKVAEIASAEEHAEDEEGCCSWGCP
jgi:hypothetical protein